MRNALFCLLALPFLLATPAAAQVTLADGETATCDCGNGGEPPMPSGDALVDYSAAVGVTEGVGPGYQWDDVTSGNFGRFSGFIGQGTEDPELVTVDGLPALSLVSDSGTDPVWIQLESGGQNIAPTDGYSFSFVAHVGTGGQLLSWVGEASSFQVILTLFAGDTFQIDTRGTPTSVAYVSGPATGSWHVLVVSVTDTELRAWVDGGPVQISATTGLMGTGGAAKIGGAVYAGALIHGLRGFNRTLSDAEAAGEYALWQTRTGL